MGIGRLNITIIAIVGVFGFLLGSFGINSSNDDFSLQTESVMAIGHLELVLRDADGNMKQYIQTDNIVVDIGLNTMADLIFLSIDLNGNVTDNKFGFLGIGTSGSPAGSSDIGLGGIAAGCPIQSADFISGAPASSPNGALITLGTIFDGSLGCSGTFAEAVIANSVDDAEILTHRTFSPITIGSSDTLDVTWDIDLG